MDTKHLFIFKIMVITLIQFHINDVKLFMIFIHVIVSYYHYINLNMKSYLWILYSLMLLLYKAMLYHFNLIYNIKMPNLNNNLFFYHMTNLLLFNYLNCMHLLQPLKKLDNFIICNMLMPTKYIISYVLHVNLFHLLILLIIFY